MGNYPESLVERCNYLEKVNANLRDSVVHSDEHVKKLRDDIGRLYELLEKDPELSRVWIYQGDGYDHINSMVSDLPVLIKAGELRELLESGETVVEE